MLCLLLTAILETAFVTFSSYCVFRKELKFVAEVEEEMKNLIELTNKVRRSISSPLWCVSPSSGYPGNCARTINIININSKDYFLIISYIF